MSLGLCFRKINMISGYRMGWKEKGLVMRVLILLVAGEESSSGYLRQEANVLVE